MSNEIKINENQKQTNENNVKEKRKRSDRKFKKCMFIAYPDSFNIEDIERLKWKFGIYDYTYILHNRDLDENGVLKKPHYHIIIRMHKEIRTRAIAKAFGLLESQESNIMSLNEWNAYRYLLHIDDKDKAQYNESEIVSTEDISGMRLSSDKPVNDRLCNLQTIIKDIQEYSLRNVGELIRFYVYKNEIELISMIQKDNNLIRALFI